MHFSTLGSNVYFLIYVILLSKGFMCFIEKETQNFILKFREIKERNVLRVHGMKSDEKLSLC